MFSAVFLNQSATYSVYLNFCGMPLMDTELNGVSVNPLLVLLDDGSLNKLLLPKIDYRKPCRNVGLPLGMELGIIRFGSDQWKRVFIFGNESPRNAVSV